MRMNIYSREKNLFRNISHTLLVLVVESKCKLMFAFYLTGTMNKYDERWCVHKIRIMALYLFSYSAIPINKFFITELLSV